MVSELQTNGIQSVRQIKVVETKSVVGKGNLTEPLKLLVQYWDLEGKLLAETCQDDGDEVYEFLLR